MAGENKDFSELMQRFIIWANNSALEPATLGRPNTDGTYTIDTGQTGFVYIKMEADGSIREAINYGAPKIPGLPILVTEGRDGSLQVVGGDGLRALQYMQGFQSAVAFHQHFRGSGSEDYVEPERFMPLNVTVNTVTADADDLTVYIHPFFYLYSGIEKYWAGGAIDLTVHLPASANTWGWVKVGIDPATNTAVATAGTAYGVSLPLTVSDLVDIDFATSGYIPCGGVRLTNGQVAISDWEDVWDAARWGTGSDFAQDLSGYLLLAGRAGGQVGYGGTAASEKLTLAGTSHATPGSILINDRLEIKASSTLTLSTDAITAVGPYHVVAAESGATDDLSTIISTFSNVVLILEADVGDTITVKDGVGNIELNGGADIDLVGDVRLLLFYDGTTWTDVGGGGGSSSPLTTKGDIWIYAATDDRLPIGGTDGHVLTVDAAEAGGMKWAAAAGGGGGDLIKTTETHTIRQPIYDNTLGAAGSWDVDLTDIDGVDYSTDFDHLEFDLWGRGDVAATGEGIYVMFNSDATVGNYRVAYHYGGSAHTGGRLDTPQIGAIPAASSPANVFGHNFGKIPHYSGSHEKMAFINQNSPRDDTPTHYGGGYSLWWESNAAITSIQITTDNAPADKFDTGSRLIIYGVKDTTVVTDVSGGRGTIGAQTADATVANTVTETTLFGTFDGTKTLEADLLTAGKTIRLTLRGYLSSKASGAGTLNIKATLGGTEICSTGAITVTDNLSNQVFEAQFLLTCRTIGASGTVVAGGLSVLGDQDAGTVKTSTTTVDTTGALAIDVTATWGTADAGNTITNQLGLIEELN